MSNEIDFPLTREILEGAAEEVLDIDSFSVSIYSESKGAINTIKHGCINITNNGSCSVKDMLEGFLRHMEVIYKVPSSNKIPYDYCYRGGINKNCGVGNRRVEYMPCESFDRYLFLGSDPYQIFVFNTGRVVLDYDNHFHFEDVEDVNLFDDSCFRKFNR